MHILFQAFKDEEIEERVEQKEDFVPDASAESCVIEPAHDSQSSSAQCSQPEESPEESPEELEQPTTIHTPAILASHSVVNTCLHQVCKYHKAKIQKFKFQKLLENIKKHTRNLLKE